MIDPVSVVLAGRAIERVLITCFGGVSLILGWHLFKLGVIKQQHGEFSRNSFTFKLTAAPGIFFAIFATVIFVGVTRQPVSADYVQSFNQRSASANIHPSASVQNCAPNGMLTSDIKTTKISDAVGEGYEEVACVSDEDLRALATSIPLIRKLLDGKALSQGEDQALTRATNNLAGLQNRAILQRFSEERDRYNDWQSEHGGKKDYLKRYSDVDRQKLLTMQTLFEQTYLSPEIQ